jgi:hypothetical protein
VINIAQRIARNWRRLVVSPTAHSGVTGDWECCALASRREDWGMSQNISFSEEIDKINHAFPVALYCTKCDRQRLMKIESKSDKFAHRCTACGMARQRGPDR